MFNHLLSVLAVAPTPTPAPDVVVTHDWFGVQLSSDDARTIAAIAAASFAGVSVLVACLALWVSLNTNRWRVTVESNAGWIQTVGGEAFSVRTVEVSNTGRRDVTITAAMPFSPTGARLYQASSPVSAPSDALPATLQPGQVHSSRWYASDLAKQLGVQEGDVPLHLTAVVDFGCGRRRFSRPPRSSKDPRDWPSKLAYRRARWRGRRSWKRAKAAKH